MLKKSKRSLVLCLICTCLLLLPAVLSAQTFGDVNTSGVIDIVDALMTAQFTVGLNPTGFNQAAADVNADGSITIVDALMIAQYAVGLTPAGFLVANADANCDGSITILDALITAQYTVGLLTSFPC